jgi:MOSC domain-containing protein YiiM
MSVIWVDSRASLSYVGKLAAAGDRSDDPRPVPCAAVTSTLLHIHLALAHGAPMQAVDDAQAVTGSGLVGDRHFGRTRQVTLVCTGELEEAASELGLASIPPGATRRNLTIDLPSLPREHGARILIGAVELSVWRDCTPCEVMEESVAPGARGALADRAGISATVERGGTIRVGDPVVVEPA